MCYNYSLNTVSLSLEKRFIASLKGAKFKHVFHAKGFNHPNMPAIISSQTKDIQMFEWGLIPAWTKNNTKANQIRNYTLNASSESIFEKPAFKNNIFSQRCLIPATGFFEFQHSGKNILPYYIFIPETTIFSIAGIWDTYINDNNQIIHSYSIITKKADNFMSEIHNTKHRMPVILPFENETDWLDADLSKSDIENFFRLKNPDLDAYTISKQISKSEFNSDIPEILNKVIYPENQQRLDF